MSLRHGKWELESGKKAILGFGNFGMEGNKERTAVVLVVLVYGLV